MAPTTFVVGVAQPHEGSLAPFALAFADSAQTKGIAAKHVPVGNRLGNLLLLRNTDNEIVGATREGGAVG